MPLFRVWIGVVAMKPLWNNICSALLTVVYVKVVLETGALIRRMGRTEEARKFVHMSAASWIVFWPLFDPTHWSWRLNVVVPAVMAVRLFYKGAILKNPDDEDVQTMSRSSSPSELLYGPLQFCSLMIWIGLYQFMKQEACVIMAAVGVGDGIAPLIGQRYGRHFYRFPFARPKTLEGTMFCFLGCIAGCYLYPHLMGIPIFPLRIVLAFAAIAAIVEGCAPGDTDNVMVPIVLHFSIDKVQQWLPP